jgi:hypothetical protein
VDVNWFVAKWLASAAGERANKDMFLLDLCDVLEVPRPRPATGDPAADDYVFEADALATHEGGRTTIRKIDLYKRGAFILEAKQGSEAGTTKVGTARRDTPLWHLEMQKARGQAQGYARTLEDPPPFLIACDIGYCFDLFACFDGTGDYQPFPNAKHSRIYLRDLEQHVDRLRTVFTDPASLDPAKYAAQVTREIAAHVAELAKSLEASGHEQERVAKFLMRCLFTMFAEDVNLLPERVFARKIEKEWIPHPENFQPQVQALWQVMNTGGQDFTLGRVLRFNGGLFADPEALPLTADQLQVLHAAARCRWENVEPAIFGTLLERALDPRERHRLGAHYTPRAYVERLVRPTIEEPLRADWDVVQAEVRQLVAADKVTAARDAVRAFHDKLCKLRVLDPACGTGNFLYVTLDVFKRLEGEVNELLYALGWQDRLATTHLSVTPEQFLGIEVKPWAREIAELVLWIGYLQWEFRTRGTTSLPAEPILRDYGNIECRDAVLAWDSIVPELDDSGRTVTRWDGITFKKHPATGEDVPDESARIEVVRYVNPRRAAWPRADFIVGNPPFMGKLKMLSSLRDGYVEALRGAYEGAVADGCDYVMYWWFNAAERVATSQVRSCGLITTNSITQTFNRRVVANALEAPVHIVFAIPDHPWVDSGAAVRIAMTVLQVGRESGLLVEVRDEEGGEFLSSVVLTQRHGTIHADLRIGVDVTQVPPLQASTKIAGTGLIVGNRGFVLQEPLASRLRATSETAHELIAPLFNGKDLTNRPRGAWVIDAHGLSEDELQRRAPAIHSHLASTVLPERRVNRDPRLRERWWQFRRTNERVRAAIAGLPRFIATVETSKHRFFTFLPAGIRPEHKLVVIGSASAFDLGILSSRIHETWALSTGGWLGVGNDPVYSKTRCFDAFPFPVAAETSTERIRDLAENLDSHRKRQQALHPELTLTGMYNVLEKLRKGEALTEKEKVIHELGLVSTLHKIHDDLDAAVLDAYGWPRDVTDEQILEHLVALNAERVEEESRGLVRWLRPEYQAPKAAVTEQPSFAADQEEPVAATKKRGQVTPAAKEALAWPASLPERIAAVRDVVMRSTRAWDVDSVAKSFKRARKSDVEAVLESLAALGLLLAYDLPDGRRWRVPSRSAA